MGSQVQRGSLLKNFKTAIAEKCCHADGRHANGSPRKKIPVIVEWGEEGDSQTDVRHGVQETVAGSRPERSRPHTKPSKARQALPEPHEFQSGLQGNGQYQ